VGAGKPRSGSASSGSGGGGLLSRLGIASIAGGGGAVKQAHLGNEGGSDFVYDEASRQWVSKVRGDDAAAAGSAAHSHTGVLPCVCARALCVCA
jgi:hypothetical protein